MVIKFIKKLSSETAVFGVRDLLIEASVYFECSHPPSLEQDMVRIMALTGIELLLVERHSIKFSPNLLEKEFHTYHYHYTAKELQKLRNKSEKYSKEFYAYMLTEAFFANLGADVETFGRRENWNKLLELLKVDFGSLSRSERRLYEPIPNDWLGEEICIDEVYDIFENDYGFDLDEALEKGLPDNKPWDRFLALYSDECEIRKFRSSFCSGIALIKHCVSIEHITLCAF